MRYVYSLLLLLLPTQLSALPFDGSWREQGFLRFFTNDYVQSGARVSVVSEGTVSLLWRPVPEALRMARSATWDWAVTRGVPATDLRVKGGDDRNLSFYFVFTSAEVAASANPKRAARLLRNADTRALVYVWGGDDARGSQFVSPYHPRLHTIVLRPSGTGQFRESVDLEADYRAAFGAEPETLIGVGLSADSDDTDTDIQAQLSNFDLK